MLTSISDADATAQWVKQSALDCGFDAVRVADLGSLPDLSAPLQQFLAANYHGTMDWMADRAEWRANPQAMWPDAKSAIMVLQNYGPDRDPTADANRPERGNISVYARAHDYHDLVKKRLKRLARQLVGEYGGDVKVFVDTAPVMEKPLAQQAGLGWTGKHTNLVSRAFGSWTFIGVVMTSLELPADAPEKDHCGACRACLDACPTDAFPAPYKIDARRCISYLTIEQKGVIDAEFRPLMGNRIYGCDACLAACPWNKFASLASEAKLHARVELRLPKLADLILLDDESFRTVFRASPIKRIGRDRFVRNVLIAMGNSGDETFVPLIEQRLKDTSPLVRGMAVWALAQLVDRAAMAALRDDAETDHDVLAEWQAVLGA